jgi:hypothetical protein
MLEYLEYSDSDILERVDEYSLYCHYLGQIYQDPDFEPLIGKKYNSPIRPGDDAPSFNVFERWYNTGHILLNSEFLWKDHGSNLHGPMDIFDLVMFMHHLPSRIHAKWKICGDFNLGEAPSLAGFTNSSLLYHEPKYMEPINIKIKSRNFNARDLMYWNQFGVDEWTLNRFNCTAVDCYWLQDSKQVPLFPKGIGFAYRIFERYQLYFPLQEKKKRFRTNWTDVCIPGFKQLDRSRTDLCIITKSYKDIMCLSARGYNVIAPRGENIMLPAECIQWLQKTYKRTVTLFDNDDKHKAKFYPFEELHIPLDTGVKDPTDYCSRYGIEATDRLLKQLL